MTTKFGGGRQQFRSARPASSGRRRGAARGDAVVLGRRGSPHFGVRYSWLAAASDLSALAAPALTYSVLSASPALACAVVIATAALCLALGRAWSPEALGAGTRELRRLLRALLAAAGAVGLLSLAFQTVAGRPWVFGVLPVAAALAVAGRFGLRAVVRRRRSSAVTRVLAVGTAEWVGSLVDRTQRAPELGWAVVAACTPTGAGPAGHRTVQGVPVVGDLDAVPALAGSTRFDAVSVSQAPGWSPRRLEQLAWHLEGSDTELVVDPGLVESAGPRTRLDTVDRLHLLRLTHPALPRAGRVLKGGLERTAALLMLVLLAPLMLAAVVAVWRDGGPALVRHERLGPGGRPFPMLAFRTLGADGAVTPAGVVLRRWHLDQLPQLINVVAGSMAVVGPRPMRPSETDGEGRRTPLVKPGLTGLRAVDGALDSDEPDLLESTYLENWTLALDARLLAESLRSAAGYSPRRRVSR